MGERILVLDNGSDTIKAGFVGNTEAEVKIIPNCAARTNLKRTLVADQVANYFRPTGLYSWRPFEEGYLTDLELEKAVWKRSLGGDVLKVSPGDTHLITTAPPCNPDVLQTSFEELIFEEFGFASAYITTPATLSFLDFARRHPSDPAARSGMGMVVDVGFSATTVTPEKTSNMNSHPVLVLGHSAEPGLARRMKVAGKVMHNRLATLVSQRHVDVMNEPRAVREMFEQLCYVSQNFAEELKDETTLKAEFELPDYAARFHGRATESQPQSPTAPSTSPKTPLPSDKEAAGTGTSSEQGQSVVLSRERISVPEGLFEPLDFGIDEYGVIDAIMDSAVASNETVQTFLQNFTSKPKLRRGKRNAGTVEGVPSSLLDSPDSYSILLSSVVLSGGGSRLRGLCPRLQSCLQAAAPMVSPVTVYGRQEAQPGTTGLSDDPLLATWRGGCFLAEMEAYFNDLRVSKAEYFESGHTVCSDRFYETVTQGYKNDLSLEIAKRLKDIY